MINMETDKIIDDATNPSLQVSALGKPVRPVWRSIYPRDRVFFSSWEKKTTAILCLLATERSRRVARVSFPTPRYSAPSDPNSVWISRRLPWFALGEEKSKKKKDRTRELESSVWELSHRMRNCHSSTRVGRLCNEARELCLTSRVWLSWRDHLGGGRGRGRVMIRARDVPVCFGRISLCGTFHFS